MKCRACVLTTSLKKADMLTVPIQCSEMLICAHVLFWHTRKLRHEQAKRLPNIIVKSKARTQTQVPDSRTGRYPFPELGLFTLYVPSGSEGGEVGY